MKKGQNHNKKTSEFRNKNINNREIKRQVISIETTTASTLILQTKGMCLWVADVDCMNSKMGYC